MQTKVGTRRAKQTKLRTKKGEFNSRERIDETLSSEFTGLKRPRRALAGAGNILALVFFFFALVERLAESEDAGTGLIHRSD